MYCHKTVFVIISKLLMSTNEKFNKWHHFFVERIDIYIRTMYFEHSDFSYNEYTLLHMHERIRRFSFTHSCRNMQS